jgi:glycosyltransferase involved in cell wall biosynthesis
MADIEVCRYGENAHLRRHLEAADLVQVVSGTAMLAAAVPSTGKPLILWVATTLAADRDSKLRAEIGLRYAWSKGMTAICTRYETKALSRATHVFALSDYCLQALSDRVTKGRLSLAHCGVNTHLFCPGSTASQPGYLLAVGRFSDPRKNVKLLLESYFSAIQGLPDPPRLLIAGTAPDAEILDWCARLDDGDRVWFLGDRDPEQLAQLYRRALALVLSSDEEGLGIVILEAMASGIPVIATRCGGPETVIEDGCNGFLAPVGSVAGLSSGIRKVIMDPELRVAAGRAGRRMAECRFSLSASAEVFLSLYDKMLWRESVAA